MKAIIASALAVAALTAAVPAAAQTWGPDYGRQTPYGQNGYGQYGYGQNGYGQNGFARGPSNYQSQRIAQRIETGFRSGALTASEARSLRNRLEAVIRLEVRYGRDGYINANEGRDLDRRYAELDQRVFAEMRDRQYNGYGNNDRYGYGYGGGYYGR